MRIRCPGCAKTLSVREGVASNFGRCPTCKAKFRLPSVVRSLQPSGPAAPTNGTDIPDKQTTALSPLEASGSIGQMPPAAPEAADTNPASDPDETPAGPSESRGRVSLGVALCGASASGAVSVLLIGTASFANRGVVEFPVVVVIVILSALFAGHFTANLAQHRKDEHVLAAAGICFLMMILFATLQISKLTSQTTFQERQRMSAVLFAPFLIPVVAFVSFAIGGCFGRTRPGPAKYEAARQKWQFIASDGKVIEAHSPRQYPEGAACWRLAAALLAVSSFMQLWLQPDLAYKIQGFLASVLVAWCCVVLARRRTALDARECVEKDERPPIVYLRSFRHDGRRTREDPGCEFTYGAYALLLARTVEETLGRVMSRFGPFVAIGRPGEELPELGAARMYVEDDDWQLVVATLLEEPNGIVLLQAGETQGLRWEFQRIRKSLRAEQVLLFVPFGLWHPARDAAERYSDFREWAASDLDAELPDEIGASSFLYFSSKDSWVPHILKRDDKAANHPLAKLLGEIQRTQPLWPRRTSVGNWLLLLAVLAVGALAIGLVVYYAMNPFAPLPQTWLRLWVGR